MNSFKSRGDLKRTRCVFWSSALQPNYNRRWFMVRVLKLQPTKMSIGFKSNDNFPLQTPSKFLSRFDKWAVPLFLHEAIFWMFTPWRNQSFGCFLHNIAKFSEVCSKPLTNLCLRKHYLHKIVKILLLYVLDGKTEDTQVQLFNGKTLALVLERVKCFPLHCPLL